MAGSSSDETFLFEGFRFDPRAGGLFRLDRGCAATPVALGARALEVLAALIRRKGDLVSKDELLTLVWSGRAVEEANLNVQISKLRHVLDQDRPQGSCIQTVTGYGYRFVAEVTRAASSQSPEICGPTERAGDGTEEKEEPCRPGVADLSSAADGARLSPLKRRISDPLWRGASVAAIIGALGLMALASAAVYWRAAAFRKARLLPPPLSIVILSFINLGEDRAQQYFADGIVEDLTTDLSRVGSLFVISRNTAFAYRNRQADTKEIGRELGVRYVLTGSVERSGDRLRVSAQLSDTRTAANLWAERFDGTMGDLFAVQDEMTRRIAVALNLAMMRADAARPIEHPQALDYILRGRALMAQPASPDHRAAAIAQFERALALDPESVAARSWLARALVAGDPDKNSPTDVARAESLVEAALAAAPGSALAHYARGTVLRVQHRCEEAIPEYQIAIAADRNWLDAYANLGQCKLYTGSLQEAIPLIEQAVRLSPRDPMIGIWYARLGLAYLLQSRLDDAVYWLEKARVASPSLGYVYARLAAAEALGGKTGRAAADLARARRLSDGHGYASAAQLENEYLGVPKTRALYESVYFAGLRMAGMSEK